MIPFPYFVAERTGAKRLKLSEATHATRATHPAVSSGTMGVRE